MANHKRGSKGKARRHRSLAYAGVYGGNGTHHVKAREAAQRKAAAEAAAEWLDAMGDEWN